MKHVLQTRMKAPGTFKPSQTLFVCWQQVPCLAEGLHHALQLCDNAKALDGSKTPQLVGLYGVPSPGHMLAMLATLASG